MWTFLLGLALADPAADAMEAVVLVVTGSSTCSGAVIDTGGRVGTAYHCVAQGGRPKITTRGGQVAIGRVVAVDRRRDLALIDAPDLAGTPWLPLRTGTPELGTVVSALGHPYGVSAPQGFLEGTLRWSMTRGVVSAVGPQAVQFSAPVNPGNSGGPIVDEHGRLVAVVSRRTGGSEGLGFGARADHLQALVDSGEARGMGPVGGTWGLGPMLSAWEASSGTLAVGARLDVAIRDRVVLSGIVRWGLSPRWDATRFDAVEFPGPAARAGVRQRFGRGRFALRLDAWGELGTYHRLKASRPDGGLDLRPSSRWLGLVGGQAALGGSGFDFGCSPVGEGCVASVVLAWPGTLGVF